MENLEKTQNIEINKETNSELQKYQKEFEKLQKEKIKLEERLNNLSKNKTYDEFEILGQFNINKVITVQEFINDNIREKIII